MARSNSRTKLPFSIFSHSLCFLLFLLFFLSQVCSQLAVSHSTVTFLPGFQGPLPFHLETGYVGVDESEDVQLFYYFVKSERNPKEDPLLLWVSGGPGCSSLSGFLYEIGPLKHEIVEYNGSLPTLVLNPHSWTKTSSIIFLDLPVGTGFSYARTPQASQTGDLKSSYHANQFLRKWLIDHPEFLSNPMYLGGDSYTGITLPVTAQEISNGNEEGVKPFINLKGYLLGNPITDPVSESNSAIPFAHRMGLIPDELYESLKSCGEQYEIIETTNAVCSRSVREFHKLTSGIQTVHILEPFCPYESPESQQVCLESSSLDQTCREQPPFPPVECRTYPYFLTPYWVNDNGVREALHIKKGSIGVWMRCTFDLPYRNEIGSSFEYHVNLSTKGYRALVYSGDHDMVVPFFSTQAWIRSLNYPIVDDWRPWNVEGQIAGYTRTYSNRMTFATVKGGGHTTPESTPKESYAMFKRWISEEPL